MYRMVYLLFFFLFILPGCKKLSISGEKKEKIKLLEQTLWFKDLIKEKGDNLASYTDIEEKFKIYCRKESYAEENIKSLTSLTESAIIRIKEVLDIEEIPKGFYLFMFDTREEMEENIGLNVKGFASIRNDVCFMVYNPEIRPYVHHELFHLIAFNTWGRPSNRVLDEGGAMYTDTECLYYDNPISDINKYLYENRMWFNLNELIDDFNTKAAENDLIAYFQSSFIFRFLLQNYGRDKLKELWREGFSNFETIYSFSLDTLEIYLREEFVKLELKNVDWPELMDKGCG